MPEPNGFFDPTQITMTNSGLLSASKADKTPAIQYNLRTAIARDDANYTTTDFSGIDGAEGQSVYDNPEEIRKQRAEEQSWYSQAGHAIAQGVLGEVVGGTISGIGSIPAIFSDLKRESDGQNAEFSNTLMEIGNAISEGTREAYPIHRINPNTAFDFDDLGGWFWSGVPSMLSTLSTIVPVAGALRGASWLGKLSGATAALNAADDAGKIAKFAGKAAIGGIVARNAENMRESFSLVKDVRSQAQERLQSMSDEEFNNLLESTDDGKDYLERANGKVSKEDFADFVASRAGWESYKVNSANVVFDIFQTGLGLRALSGTTRLGAFGRSAAQKAEEAAAAGVQQSLGKKLFNSIAPSLQTGMAGSSEYVEEAINFIGEQEGRHKAETILGNDDGSTLTQRTLEYLKDKHLHEAGFWGMFGGIAHHAVGNVMSRKERAEQAKLYTEELTARTSQLKTAAALVEQLVAQKKAGKISEAQFQNDLTAIGNDAAFTVGLNAAKVGNVDAALAMVDGKEFRDSLFKNLSTKEVEDGKYEQAVEAFKSGIKAGEAFHKEMTFNLLDSKLTAAAKQAVIGMSLKSAKEVKLAESKKAALESQIRELEQTSDITGKPDVAFAVDTAADKLAIGVLEMIKASSTNKDVIANIDSKIGELKAKLPTTSLTELDDTYEQLIEAKAKLILTDLKVKTHKNTLQTLKTNKAQTQIQTAVNTQIANKKKAEDDALVADLESKIATDTATDAYFKKVINGIDDAAKKMELQRKHTLFLKKAKDKTAEEARQLQQTQQLEDEEATTAAAPAAPAAIKDAIKSLKKPRYAAAVTRRTAAIEEATGAARQELIDKLVDDLTTTGGEAREGVVIQSILALQQPVPVNADVVPTEVVEDVVLPEYTFEDAMVETKAPSPTVDTTTPIADETKAKVDEAVVTVGVENAPIVSEDTQAILADISSLMNELGKELHRGTANVGIPVSPRALELTGKIIVQAFKLGVSSFKDLAKFIYHQFGEDTLRNMFDVLKLQWSSLMLTNEQPANSESFEAIREMNLDSLIDEFAQSGNIQAVDIVSKTTTEIKIGDEYDGRVEIFLPGFQQTDSTAKSGIIKLRDGVWASTDKDTDEFLREIIELKEGDTVTLVMTPNHPMHKHTKEDSRIVISKNGFDIGVVNSTTKLVENISAVQRQIDSMLQNEEEVGNLTRFVARLQQNLLAINQLREVVWNNPNAEITTTVNYKSSGTLIKSEKLSNPLDVLVGDWKLAFTDPASAQDNRRTLLIANSEDEFQSQTDERHYNSDKGYNSGEFYVIVNGLNGQEIPLKLQRGRLTDSSAREVYRLMREAMLLLWENPNLSLGADERLNDLRTAIGTIVAFTKSNRNADGTIPKPLFKIHKDRVEFLFDNNTKLGTVYLYDYDSKTQTRSKNLKFQVHEWKGRKNTFTEQEHKEARGKQIGETLYASKDGGKPFVSAIIDALQQKHYHIPFNEVRNGTVTAEQLFNEGRLLADFGVLQNSEKTPISNFQAKNDSTVKEDGTESKRGNFIVGLSSKVQVVKKIEVATTENKPVTNVVAKPKIVVSAEGTPNVDVTEIEQIDLDTSATLTANAEFDNLFNGEEVYFSLSNNEKVSTVELPTLAEREANWKSIFGDNVPFDGNVDRILTENGTEAFGVFTAALTQVVKGAPKGTEYHEAFHAVMHLYLTQKEQRDVLNEARKTHSKFVTSELKSKYKSMYPNMTDSEIEDVILEELLAEDFRMWMNLKDLPVRWRFSDIIKGLFERLASFARGLFGLKSNKDLFRDIRSGRFKYQPDTRTAAFGAKIPRYSSSELNARFTPQEVAAYTDYMSMRVAQFIPHVEKATRKDVAENPKLYNLKAIIREALVRDYQSRNTKGLTEAATEITRILNDYDLFWAETVKVVNRKLNYDISFSEEDTTAFEGNAQLSKSWDDKLAYSRSQRESVDFNLRRLIMTTPNVSNSNVRIEGINTIMSLSAEDTPFNYTVDNVALLPTALDFNKVYPMLQNVMTDANTEDEMMERLWALRDVEPAMALLYQRINSNSVTKASWFFNFKKAFLPQTHFRLKSNNTNGFDIEHDTGNKRYGLANTFVSAIRLQVSEYNKVLKKQQQADTELTKYNKTWRKEINDLDTVAKNDKLPLSERIVAFHQMLQMLDIAVPLEIVQRTVHNPIFNRGSAERFFNSEMLASAKWIARTISDASLNNRQIAFSDVNRVNKLGEYFSYYLYDTTDASFRNVEGNTVFSMVKPNFLTEFFDVLKRPYNSRNVNTAEAQQELLELLRQYALDPALQYDNWLWNDGSGKGLLKVTSKQKDAAHLTVEDINFDFIKNLTLANIDGAKNRDTEEGASYSELSDSDWTLFVMLEYLTNLKDDITGFPVLIQSDSGNLQTVTSRRIRWEGTGITLAANSRLFTAIENTVYQEMVRMEVAKDLLFEYDTVLGEFKPKNLSKEEQRSLLVGYHYSEIANEDVIFEGKVLFKKGEPVTMKAVKVSDTETQLQPTGRVFKFSNTNFTGKDGTVQSLNNNELLFKAGILYDRSILDAKAKLSIQHHVKQFIDSLLSEAVSDFAEYEEIIKGSNETRNGGKIELLGKYSSYGENAFRVFVSELELNTYLTYVAHNNFFNGTIAEYKNWKDTNKRAKQQSSPKQRLSTIHRGETYNAITLADIELTSTFYDSIVEGVANNLKKQPQFADLNYDIDALRKSKLPTSANALEKTIHSITKAYLSTNIADAQGFVTLDRYEAILKDAGRWVEAKHAPLFVKLRAGEDLSIDEIANTLEVLKPFYYERSFDSRTGMVRSRQIKTSLMPLLPQMVRGTQMEQLMRFAEANNISEIYFESAVKVGRTYVPQIADENGNLIEGWEDLVAIEKYSNAAWGLQLDVASHLKDEKNKLGTQIAKLVFANLSKDAIYEVDGRTYNGDEIRQLFFDTLSANIEEDATRLLERLNVKQNADGDYYFEDYESVHEILVEELESKGLPENMLEAIKLIDTGTGLKEFNIPLFTANMVQKYQSILTSLFTNNVTNQKLPGGHVVIASSVFSTVLTEQAATNGITFTEKVQQRIKDTGKFQLQYRTVENDKVLHVEVLLPSWSKDFYNDGKLMDIDELPEEVRTMIGYRIPTEDKYSTVVFEVVGFLPDAMGSTIVMPFELVSQTGWDFDVDSLYMMMRNHKRLNPDKQTVFEFVKKITDASDTEVLKVMDKIRAKKQLNDYETLIKSAIEEFNKSNGRIEPVLYDSTKSISDNSRKARENRIFDIFFSILTNKAHYQEIVSPGKFTDPKALKDKQEELLGLKSQNLNPNTRRTQMAFRQANIAGRALKGQAADINGTLPILQNIKARFARPFIVRYDLSKYDEASLRARYGEDFMIEGATEKAKVSLPMTFVYGQKDTLPARSDLKSKTTFEAIVKGERTATSRKDGSLDKLEIGDVISFHSGNETVTVRITDKRKLDTVTPEEFSEVEGYDLEAVEKNWTTGKNFANDYTQIIYEKVESGNPTGYGVVRHRHIAHAPDGSFVNVNGDTITNHAAQMLAMILDIVKEGLPYNINTHTFNTFMAMVSTGIDIQTAGMFMRQPILNRFSTMVQNNKSVLDKTQEKEYSRIKRLYQSQLLKLLVLNGERTMEDAIALKAADKNGWFDFNKRAAFIPNEQVAQMLGYLQVPAVLELKALEKGIATAAPENWKVATRTEKIRWYREQLQLLETFQSFQKNGKALSDAVRVLNTDKLGAGPSLMVTSNWEANARTVAENNDILLTNADGESQDIVSAVYSENSVYSILNTYFHKSNKLSKDVLSQLFVENSTQHTRYKEAILNGLRKTKVDESLQTTISKFLSGLTVAQLSYFDKFDKFQILGIEQPVNLETNLTFEQFSLLSAAEQVRYVQLKYPELNTKFSILSRFRFQLDSERLNKNSMHKIEFMKPRTSDNLDDTFVNSFGELLTSNIPEVRTMAESLVAYDYFTSKFLFTANSWSTYVPVSFLTEQMKLGETLRKIAANSESEMTYDANVVSDWFFRNNWRNRNIVPLLKSEYQRGNNGQILLDDDGHKRVKWKTFDWDNSHSPNRILKVPNDILKNISGQKRYILLSRNGISTLFRRFETDETHTSFEPVSKLGDFNIAVEFSTESLIPSNNVPFVSQSAMTKLLEQTNLKSGEIKCG